jgi:hypothetical protein
MPNGVKYSTTTPTGALRKDNVALGVNGNLGPTGTTGFYSMVTPASGKYTINKVSVSGVPNFFTPQNDAELIRFARSEGATGADTGSADAVLAWVATQPNLMAANFQYEDIVTDDLVLNIDAGFVGSYPTTGTTVYPISNKANVGNGTLQNGVGFTSNTGSFIFDGADDQIPIASSNNFQNIDWSTGFTLMVWYKIDDVTDFNSQFRCMIGVTGGGRTWNYYLYGPNTPATQLYYHFSGMGGGLSNLLTITTGIYHLGSFTIKPGDDYGTYYHDGNAVGTQGAPSIPYYNTDGGDQYLGRGDNFWKGNIGNWMIYNKALTPNQILQNYNAQKSRFGI